MTRAAVALGSNLGDRIRHLCRAVEGLKASATVVAVSSVYETAPVGGPEQGPYLNAVVVIDTDLDAHGLLEALHVIEQEAGRERTVRWGPRTLDLDLILFGDQVIDDDTLTVPHPRLAERRFVLEPLTEVWPDAKLPDGAAVAELLDDVQDQQVHRTHHRLRPKPRDGFAARGGWWVVMQGVVLAAATWAVVADGGSLPWPGWVSSLGVAVFAGGAVQSLLGLQHLGANLTPYPEPLSGARLVALGVYRWVRHPIYGGIVMMILGAALFRLSAWTLLVGLAAGVFFWMKARFEERRLMEHYPGYAAYRSQVRRRLIPWIV